jgi:hypothetical protein
MARPEVECSENNALGIEATEHHRCALPSLGPSRSEVREEPQVSFILKEHSPSWPQLLHVAPNSSFFSPTPDRVPNHSEAVSTQNRSVAAHAAGS